MTAVSNAIGAKPLVEVRDLVTRFDLRGGIFGGITGRVHAVEGVPFDIFPGETLALVGESGCGKSTVARSIMHLDKPQSGSIRYDDKEMIGAGRKALASLRREVQMVFQDPFSSLNPRMTIAQAVTDPMRVHRIASGSELHKRAANFWHRWICCRNISNATRMPFPAASANASV